MPKISIDTLAERIDNLSKQLSSVDDKLENLRTSFPPRTELMAVENRLTQQINTVDSLAKQKADAILVIAVQKKLDDDVEVRLQAVERTVISRDKQESFENTITWLKVTLTLFGLALAACLIMVSYHIMHTPIT